MEPTTTPTHANGAPFGSNQYTVENYSEGYPDGINDHYWNHARNLILVDLLHKWGVGDDERILEIGCGRGFVVEYLRRAGFDCYGSELAPAPVADTVKSFVYASQDAYLLPEDFRGTIRHVLLLDVLEHIEDTHSFLQAMRKAFPNLKRVIFMVPARKEIWSNHDVHYGHFRRYDRDLIRKHCEEGGFKVAWSSYLFHSLYLAARVLMKLKGERDVNLRAPSGLAILIHRLISWILVGESAALPGSWPGSSVIAVAQVIDAAG